VQAAVETEWVVERGRALGFDLCGVTSVEDLSELQLLPEWLERGYAGEMDYLRDPRRLSPARVLQGARSIIVCALNYNTPLPYSTEVPAGADPRGWISRYAWGEDYHLAMSRKLEALVQALRERSAEPFEARAYVDTGPVVERVAARHAGLGWLAKNTCLINEKVGSWLFLGVIVTTLELAPSLGLAEAPPPDLCGQCRLCIDACPTGAIVEPYVLDSRRCISYLTIELRGSIPTEFREPMGRMVFGCDICQDVCPWNRAAPATSIAAFLPREVEGKNSLFSPELEWLAWLSEEEFREVFRSSAVKRTKWRGLVRNACVAVGNSGVRPGTAAYSKITGLLDRLAGSDDTVIAEHARWALSRLRSKDTLGV
jgi:epoxyqueuosine reductase